ncbi:MAG: hypothetical protein COV60_00205 [Candidatus Magasanikbacteria bacterium CG11_big_fil_rev_8_21_14_0_20_43_7]|uniref:Glycosyl transferase family 1 n=1 Tax=Candidatus Magasanikbacteria bacterium CG11_big_fil_rev_8_21_14_0_20_43_7 TaxID=1974654 RepID=A0A2H0N3J6_9BACT|nr:MAG: hypothetical protein COV60_00205 [Candidatus Magasanikbacteria bacterium CG11_big_fil_rev_8_21_14_0_20_43_7]
MYGAHRTYMKIGIDARMYGPRNAGLGRYIEQLIEQLKYLDDEHEYVIFLKQESFDAFQLPNQTWKKVLADVSWYGWKEQLFMPSILRQEHIDLMHFPHWNVPILYRKKFVVTIHDLIMFHFSRKEATTHGSLVYFLKDQLHRFLVRSVARRASSIFTTSEYTKQDIVKTLRIELKKIHVTYQAPFLNNEQRATSNEQVVSLFGIKKPYVLYVGNAYPHKNLERLVQAWNIVEQEAPGYQLVFAGKDSVFYENIKKSTQALKHSSTVVFTGYVSDEELGALYENADLSVFPSLYEGFGLPPLEAMAHGVPVVSSNASCLPEVLGEAALYFDPESIDDMALAIIEGIRNEDIRYTMRQNAKEELKRYSWKRCAEQMLNVYTTLV